MPWFLPILVFLARITDVSLGTIRIIFVVRGYCRIAPILGFFEVSIWVLAVSGTLKYLSNPLALIAYAGGFATGTAVGIWLERTLAVGFQLVRAINVNPSISLAEKLRESGYPVTKFEGQGGKGKTELCLIVVPRDQVKSLEELIFNVEPNAFVTIEDVREIVGGVMRKTPSLMSSWLKIIKFK